MHFIFTFFNHCHMSLEQHGGIILSLLIAGLVGGFTHCAGMCGPFVMGQVISRSSKIPSDEFNQMVRLKEAAILPYHFGRLSTYMLLAVILSLFSNYVMALTSFKMLTAFFMIVAAFLLFGSSFSIFKFLPFLKIKGFRFSPLKTILSPLFADPRGIKGYFLGVFLGFIPCGLTMAALLISASAGDVFTSVFAMFVFGISTIPALFLVGYGSCYITAKYKKEKIRKVAKVIMAFNSLSLLLMAGRIIFR